MERRKLWCSWKPEDIIQIILEEFTIFDHTEQNLVTTNSLQSLFDVFKEIELNKQEFEEAIF